MNDPDCIFCKIVAKQVPSVILREDDFAMAFLDIAPFEKGHALVIPKCHAERLTDLPLEWLTGLMPLLRDTARRLVAGLPCDGFNILQSNGRCATQVVPHVHFHVIPRWNGRPIKWTSGAYDSSAEMEALAVRLRAV
ncbi:MAG: HIT family protein [Kiritimatiellae bacterium]|nr:HIT family protein [Kiritimatiellia bacterium]